MQGTELGGEEKTEYKTEYKTIYDNTCTYLIQKMLQQWGKGQLKI